MSHVAQTTHEQLVGRAFDKQSAIFDQLYVGNEIIQYKRARVRQHVTDLMPVSCNILELNAGTGDDAIYFARLGHSIHATDISEGMQQMLVQKISSRDKDLQERISTEICSFTELEHLHNKGPFDYVFSNFAGLNCTNQVEKVLSSFSPLVKRGGFVTLVILPKFCLWETLLIFKGKFGTAFRRFFSKSGRKAHIEGEHFLCWYYNPSTIRKYLMQDFKMRRLEGLCTIVPPSYIEGFGKKYPRLLRTLQGIEDRWKSRWPWRSIGDYYIISFQRQ